MISQYCFFSAGAQVLDSFQNPSPSVTSKNTIIEHDIKPKKRFYTTASVKIKSSNLAKTKDAIEKTWDKYYPEYANTSSFMDENINAGSCHFVYV